MRKRIVRVLALVVAVAGCSNPSAPRPRSPIGTYTLERINRLLLPVTRRVESENGWEVQVTGGTLTLRDDSTFSQRVDYIDIMNGTPSSPLFTAYDGRYTRIGTTTLRLGLATGPLDYPADIVDGQTIKAGGGEFPLYEWTR